MALEGFDKKKAKSESLEDPDVLLDRAIRKGKEALSAQERAALNQAYPGILDPDELDKPYYQEGKYH